LGIREHNHLLQANKRYFGDLVIGISSQLKGTLTNSFGEQREEMKFSKYQGNMLLPLGFIT